MRLIPRRESAGFGAGAQGANVPQTWPSDHPMRLADLPTPSLILDRTRLAANCAAMAARARALGVRLRPHLKTAKSADAARIATRDQFGGITVSTLAEARYFAAHGFRDITYGVGIAPAKLEEVARLQADGARLQLVTDDVATVFAVAKRAAALGADFQLLIEIDTGGGRAGVLPDEPEVLDIGRAIAASPRLSLLGVMTHAGHSYRRSGAAAIAEVAEEERAGVVRAAERLRDAGLPAPVVSVGATPTAMFARALPGVTEMRPGVYTLMDLYQLAIGVCGEQDIAASVLATVIGHNPRTGRILVDAGALALSQDRGAASLMEHTGFGWVCEAESGARIPGLYVAEVNQEHGMIASAAGAPPFARLPLGARLRILPNHVCMMAAPYDRYHVVEGGDEVIAVWDKATGW
jgi:D-serine deaminase-like pyridoxal phosphate-dependent protein